MIPSLMYTITHCHCFMIIEVLLLSILYLHPSCLKNVLYIKEITRVKYIDTLIKEIMEIYMMNKQIPLRVLVLEGDFALGKVPLYPELVPSYSLTVNDVINSNILMLGFQKELFEDIMRNPNKQDSILILDRTGYKEPHLISKGVEYMFTISDLDDLKNSHIPQDRVISYSKKGLHIPFIKDFSKLSPTEVLREYSSMDIVKTIITLMEK